MLIVAYLFLGGCGGGIMLVMSVWSWLFHLRRDRTREETRVFKELKGRAFVTGFVVVCLAAICLLFDLGRPDQALLIFILPTRSLITIGAFALLACMAVGAFLAVANTVAAERVPVTARKAAEVPCAIASLVLIAYTGAFLWNLEGVPLWHTPSLLVLFVASSLSAGLSSVFLMAAVTQDFDLIEASVRRLHLDHLIVVVVEIVAFVLFLLAAATNESADESLALLFSRDMLFWTVGGLAMLGLAAPLATEVAIVASRHSHQVFPADMACIVGSFCLRYCVVAAGLH